LSIGKAVVLMMLRLDMAGVDPLVADEHVISFRTCDKNRGLSECLPVAEGT
jgi:hypothetical protein